MTKNERISLHYYLDIFNQYRFVDLFNLLSSFCAFPGKGQTPLVITAFILNVCFIFTMVTIPHIEPKGSSGVAISLKSRFHHICNLCTGLITYGSILFLFMYRR